MVEAWQRTRAVKLAGPGNCVLTAWTASVATIPIPMVWESPSSWLLCGERSRLGCRGRRPADRTLCLARAPNTAREAREARALPTLIKDIALAIRRHGAGKFRGGLSLGGLHFR